MTELVLYEAPRRKSMIYMIASFFADHFTISEHAQVDVTEERLSLAEENLNDWLSEDETRVFFVEEDGVEAGILILKTHGGSVVMYKLSQMVRTVHKKPYIGSIEF